MVACLCGLLATLAPRAAPIIATVDRGGDVGAYTSMQLNGGNPVVSYHDLTNGDLKLATCTGGCASATPTWVVTTIDSTGNVGWYTSLQLNGGNPVVSYYDVGRGALKLATCTAGCATPSPTWVVTTVDNSSADTGRFPSLQLNAGSAIISYRDRANGDLKLATCTGGCATPAPTWLITTVDSAGDVGRFTSMRLNDGRPVIGYLDFSLGNVKLATCSAGCATATPTWVFSVIDSVPGDEEMQISLQLNGGNPVVSYYDAPNGSLKLATCTAACATATPTWVVTTVDRGGDARAVSPAQQSAGNAGVWSSLQLRAGNPVIAYYGSLLNCTTTGSTMSCGEAGDLRLATCIANCDSAAPTWVITTVDNDGIAGWDPSLQLDGGTAVASYYDFTNGDLKVARVDLAAASIPSNYTALWWNSSESGWGVNFSHQGDIVFATLFTYDASGEPMWLVMSAGAKQSADTFSGALYRTTGPAFDANPFTPIGPSNVTAVGTMTVRFAGDSAAVAYSVNGTKVQKTVRKQVFGAHAAACQPTTADRGALTNYQDLWWNAAESGWGVNVTHQGDVIFATLFTYGANGRGLWLVLPGAAKQADGAYAGDLYRTTGPPFNAAPFRPIGAANLTKAGTAQLRFADGARGTLTYSVNGVSVVKSITRQTFGSPFPACSSG